MKQSEKQIENDILEYLDRVGFLSWKNQTTGIYDPTKKTFRRKSKYQMNGVSDILLVIKLHGIAFTVYMEVKAKDGKQTESQKEFQRQIESRNGFYYIVQSIDDAIDAIDVFKIMASRQINLAFANMHG